jgi:AcrR family transcriptional regulator
MAKRKSTVDESATGTRTKILEAARSLVLKRAGGEVSMAEIAKAAGVSRQAVYLHFADRGALFIALVKYADEKRGLEGVIASIRNAPTGIAALRAMAEAQARTNPDIWPLARASEAIRRTDEAMERAWQNRLQERHAGCKAIVKRLAKEGSLRQGLPIDVATDLLWTITSIRTWEDLALERKWKKSEYEQHVSDVLLRVLTKQS